MNSPIQDDTHPQDDIKPDNLLDEEGTKVCVFIVKAFLIFSAVSTLSVFFPLLFFRYIIVPVLNRQGMLYCLLGAYLLIVDVFCLILSAVVTTGIAARILDLKYEGNHRLNLQNRDVQKWILSLLIYLPTAVVLDLFHLYPLKNLHIRLFGGKIERGAVVGGLVLDPALLEVGERSIIGGFSTILGHAVERGNILYDSVRIGKRCGVGTRATILPGAVMEDGSILAAQSLLPKNRTVPAGKIAFGVPVKQWRR